MRHNIFLFLLSILCIQPSFAALSVTTPTAIGHPLIEEINKLGQALVQQAGSNKLHSLIDFGGLLLGLPASALAGGIAGLHLTAWDTEKTPLQNNAKQTKAMRQKTFSSVVSTGLIVLAGSYLVRLMRNQSTGTPTTLVALLNKETDPQVLEAAQAWSAYYMSQLLEQGSSGREQLAQLNGVHLLLKHRASELKKARRSCS